MNELTVYVVQMTSGDQVVENFQHIIHVLNHLPKRSDYALVCLPENALFLRIEEKSTIPEISLSDPKFEQIKNIAQEKNFFVHIGSAPVRSNGGLSNASLLITPYYQLSLSYEKLHLFDIQLESGLSVRESDVFRHGILPKTFWIEDWLIGQSICYDIRFSELYNFYARIPVDLILIPSAFLVPTGEAHWHVLNRARAIESQCYIVSAAQAGVHKNKKSERRTYGHSLVVDPWGIIIAESLKSEPEVLMVTLKKEMIKKVRNQIPMFHHRRYHL